MVQIRQTNMAIKRNVQVGCLAFLWALSPAAAQAFPVAEGAGALSSMVGIVTSVIVGFFPKRGVPGLDRRFAAAVSASIILFMIACGSLAWNVVQHQKSRDWDLIAAQSRPRLELAGEIDRQISEYQAPNLSAKDVIYAQKSNLFIDLDTYRAGLIAETATRVFLDYDELSRLALPHRTTINLSSGDDQALLRLATQHKGDLLLVANHPGTVIKAARLIERQTGHMVKGLAIQSDAFSIRIERQTEDSEYPVVHDPHGIFGMRVIDIRTHHNVIETHTLVNAFNIPLTDILLMRDSEIKSLFPEGGKPTVLLSYDESLYPAAHARLKEVVPGRYAFYQGGLERHFLEDRLTIVPYFFNMRFVDPLALTRVYGLTDDVRFICTVPDQCQDNIPLKDRVDIPFRDMEKHDFIQAIKNLPDDKLYVTVTSNQETYGNSLIAGYWLVSSDHNYLGDLVMPGRFSLEELRAIVNSEMQGRPTLEDWRNTYSISLGFMAYLKEAVGTYGWITTFAALGILLRLLLTPFQIIVFGSYYRTNQRLLPMLLAALVIPGSLIGAYQLLNTAITYYAVVPHGVMDDLFKGQIYQILPWFIAMIAVQIFISFPRRLKTAFTIIGLVVFIWAMGWMNALSLPLLVFLMASEAMAILLQFPFFVGYLARVRAEQRGIITDPLPERPASEYPAKWRDLMDFHPQPGILVEISKLDPDDTLLHRKIMALPGKMLIVRSAALDPREECLGGYYESYITSRRRQDISNAINTISQSDCAFAWIQPFIEADENGVLSSISRDGRRGECLSGPGTCATEGAKEAKTTFLDTPEARHSHRAEWCLLRAAERHAGGPVVLEYGRKGRRVIPYQIRKISPATHPETRLWPGGIDKHTLADSYLAICSLLTGEVIQEATRGTFVPVRGFLYQKSSGHMRALRISRREMSSIEEDVIAFVTRAEQSSTMLPGKALLEFEDGILLMRKLFRATQAHKRPDSIITSLATRTALSHDTPELEIIGRKTIHANSLAAQSRHVDTREHLHDLIVLTTYALNHHLHCIVPDKSIHEQIGLDDIRGHSTGELQPVQKDALPLTELDEQDTVIVCGPIQGKCWPADRNDLPPPDSGPWVLVGEEVGSQWVKHLDRFVAIASVYGHTNAHLGLSARSLGLPYRKIKPDTLSLCLSKGEISLI